MKQLWIQKLQPPTIAKGCRSFAGMVNFLSMFSPELDLTKSPVLHLPNSMGRSTCIQTQVNLQWEAHYIIYRMENQN